ncbi:MAG: phosphoenolpyruvate carboxykinase (ATP), partial [Thermodesulfobacteriota bacterium]
MVDNSFIRKELSEKHGLINAKNIFYNLSVPELYEISIKDGKGHIVEGGSLVAYTGSHTGRSPKDRFVVKEPTTENNIHWGSVNQPISPEAFDSLYKKVMNYFVGKDVFVRDLNVCAHPNHKTNVRVINEYAWHNIFVNNLFIRPDENLLPHKDVGFTVISAPNFKADPTIDGT